MSDTSIPITNTTSDPRTKYRRVIYSVDGNHPTNGIQVDVYCVLDAFGVTCQPTGHAIKKLLCAGLRGKGDRIQDLSEAIVSLERAIQQEKQRCQSVRSAD